MFYIKKSAGAILSLCCIASLDAHAGRSEPYDSYLAVQYARSWALSRNSVYPDFSANSGGGDCTNFASQVLRAGGFRNTVTDRPTSDQRWYFVSKTSYSQTWSVAQGLYNRFKNGYENWYSWSGVTSLNYGDLVFADWQGDGLIDHTMIVTGFKKMTDGTVDPVFSYHSSDRLNFTRTALVAAVGPSARYYRFGKSNQCLIVPSDQYVK